MTTTQIAPAVESIEQAPTVPTYHVEWQLVTGPFSVWKGSREAKEATVVVDGLDFEEAFDYAQAEATEHGDPDEYAQTWTEFRVVSDLTGNVMATWVVA